MAVIVNETEETADVASAVSPADKVLDPLAVLQARRADLHAEWKAFGVADPADVADFYAVATKLGPDLDAWHALDVRQAWTKRIVDTALAIGARKIVDVGCGAGHDLKALIAAGVTDVFGVEPNEHLRGILATTSSIDYSVDVANAPIEDADLILCVDVLEHVVDPESFITAFASRAYVGAWLVETTATEDIDNPLHLKTNRGWHPGRALERIGWVLQQEVGRYRTWRRLAFDFKPVPSVLLVTHRGPTAMTHQAIVDLARRGWRDDSRERDADIGRARSRVVSRWWRETSDDVFLMIDDDIHFTAEAADHAVKLVRDGLPIVAAAYPVHNGAHLALKALTPANIPFGPNHPPIEIRYAATGFMAVHRRVIDALVPTLPLLMAHDRHPFWPFFTQYWVPDGDAMLYLSEDWAFCDRARNQGFQVWLDPSIHLTHLVPVPMDVQSMHRIHAALERAPFLPAEKG